jgi:hypothetical protein
MFFILIKMYMKSSNHQLKKTNDLFKVQHQSSWSISTFMTWKLDYSFIPCSDIRFDMLNQKTNPTQNFHSI